MLGLPDDIRACLFDLDGVLTNTAAVHQRAWKSTFDSLLAQREGQSEFTSDDYHAHVDGKPRKDGVRDFLSSRGIEFPEGDDSDPADAETIAGVATKKNDLVLKVLADNGVEVFEDAMRYLRAVSEAGLRIAVVTASANGAHVIETGGFADFVETRVDGVVAKERGLKGKPAPDTYLAAAEALDVPAAAAVVFEDAQSGVKAGRAGDFGYVVGIDRVGQAAELERAGAHVVVTDFDQLLKG